MLPNRLKKINSNIFNANFYIYIPQHIYLSHESPLDFCSSRVEKRVFPSATNFTGWLSVVTGTYHLEKFVESCIYFLFFIVGKVAILSTFLDWRKSMYSEVWTLKKLYSKFWNWLAGIFRRSNYQDVPGYSGNIRENIGFQPKKLKRLVQENKKKKKKSQLKIIPNRAHHLCRRQVFSVASVYPIVPAAPSSSSSSRLLYPDVTSLLLMNFLITMPLFFFIYRTLPLYFFFFDKMPLFF